MFTVSEYQLSPATIFEFQQMFPDEQAAVDYFAGWRWPDGFTCPCCSSFRHIRLKTRALWECLDCRHQTSVRAGTVMHKSKVPLRIWLYALWSVGRRKAGISALQFQKEVGFGSYRTAWTLLHKVRRVLNENDEYPLKEGKVEVDESMVNGAGPGSSRRGRRLGDGDAWVVAAVERLSIQVGDDAREVAGSARLEVIRQTDAEALTGFVDGAVAKGTTVVTDAWPSYDALGSMGYTHEEHVQTSAQVTAAVLPKVHILFSNLKAWLLGTFHGVSAEYLWSYCREYLYRFNRRHLDPKVFGFLARRLVSRPWTSNEGLRPGHTGSETCA